MQHQIYFYGQIFAVANTFFIFFFLLSQWWCYLKMGRICRSRFTLGLTYAAFIQCGLATRILPVGLTSGVHILYVPCGCMPLLARLVCMMSPVRNYTNIDGFVHPQNSMIPFSSCLTFGAVFVQGLLTSTSWYITIESIEIFSRFIHRTSFSYYPFAYWGVFHTRTTECFLFWLVLPSVVCRWRQSTFTHR